MKNAPRRRPMRRTQRIQGVHRLDRDTSGLMLFALTPGSRDALIALFARHAIQRTYWSVVHGHIYAPMCLRSSMIRDRGDGLRGSVNNGLDAADLVGAKPAVTHVKPLEQFQSVAGHPYSIVQCRLETGRTHQIRIHLAEAGHMVCGERQYLRAHVGAERVIDQSDAPRQALHSSDLRFTHPGTGRALEFSSPPPADLRRWIERLRGAGAGGL